MSINNSVSFTETCQQIVNSAFSKIAIKGNGRSLVAEDMTFGMQCLNEIIKSWMTFGLHLWSKAEGVMFLTPNQNQYTFGTNNPQIYATLLDNSVTTATTTSNNIGDTVINLVNLSNNNNTKTISVNDNIGIVNPDNTIFWTTVTSIIGNAVTLSGSLTQANQQGCLVYAFSTQLTKPARILNCRRVTGYNAGSSSQSSSVNMSVMGYEDYQSLTNKYIPGTPISYVYMPYNTTGDLYLWQCPRDANYRIEFTFERVLTDVINVTDNIDFPQEWIRPLVYNLAVDIAPTYGRGQKVIQDKIDMRAEQLLQELLGWDNEISYFNFYPDSREP